MLTSWKIHSTLKQMHFHSMFQLFSKTRSPSYNISVVKYFKNVTLRISSFISVSYLSSPFGVIVRFVSGMNFIVRFMSCMKHILERMFDLRIFSPVNTIKDMSSQ